MIACVVGQQHDHMAPRYHDDGETRVAFWFKGCDVIVVDVGARLNGRASVRRLRVATSLVALAPIPPSHLHCDGPIMHVPYIRVTDRWKNGACVRMHCKPSRWGVSYVPENRQPHKHHGNGTETRENNRGTARISQKPARFFLLPRSLPDFVLLPQNIFELENCNKANTFHANIEKSYR